MEPKVYIIVGHYGSGKSEFALKLAKILSESQSVYLADLDIVNPYFRSRESREEMKKLGIEIFSDTLNSTQGLDMPYLSPAISGIIALKTKTVVLDCGGDEVGIRILKQFQATLQKTNYELLMVINPYRPITSNVNQIITMKERLESESKLVITGYVNNSNLLRFTTVNDVIIASKIISEVSKKTNIPIKYLCGIVNVIDELPSYLEGERVVLDLMLRKNWL